MKYVSFKIPAVSKTTTNSTETKMSEKHLNSASKKSCSRVTNKIKKERTVSRIILELEKMLFWQSVFGTALPAFFFFLSFKPQNCSFCFPHSTLVTYAGILGCVWPIPRFLTYYIYQSYISCLVKLWISNSICWINTSALSSWNIISFYI